MSTDEHQSIDESFLQELDDFREELARAYKRKNPELDGAELTEVLPKSKYSRKYLLGLLNSTLLEWFIHQTATPPAQAPTLGEATRWIAQLGGFLGRRGDGNLGTTEMGRRAAV